MHESIQRDLVQTERRRVRVGGVRVGSVARVRLARVGFVSEDGGDEIDVRHLDGGGEHRRRLGIGAEVEHRRPPLRRGARVEFGPSGHVPETLRGEVLALVRDDVEGGLALLETTGGVRLRGVHEGDEGVVHLGVAGAAQGGEVGVTVFSPHGEDVVAHLGRGGGGAELAGRGAEDVHGEDAVLPREDGEVGGVREPRGGISRERRLAARVEAEPSALARGAEDVRGGVSRDGERGVGVRRGGFPLHRGIAARVRGERDGDADDRQEHHQHRARHVRKRDDFLLGRALALGGCSTEIIATRNDAGRVHLRGRRDERDLLGTPARANHRGGTTSGPAARAGVLSEFRPPDVEHHCSFGPTAEIEVGRTTRVRGLAAVGILS